MSIHYKSLIILFSILTLLTTNSYAQPAHTPGTPWPGYVGYYVKHYPDGTVKEEGTDDEHNEINHTHHLPRHIICYARNGTKTFEYWRHCADNVDGKYVIFSADTGIFYDKKGRIESKGQYKIEDSLRTHFWTYYDSTGKIIKNIYFDIVYSQGSVDIEVSPGIYKSIKKDQWGNSILFEIEYYADGTLKRYFSRPGYYEKQFYPDGKYKIITYDQYVKVDGTSNDSVMHLRVYYGTDGKTIVKIERNQHFLVSRTIYKDYDEYWQELSITPELLKKMTYLKKVRKKKPVKFTHDKQLWIIDEINEKESKGFYK